MVLKPLAFLLAVRLILFIQPNNIRNFTNREGLHVADAVGGELKAYLRGALAPGPLSLSYGADNFGKIWSACGQHEIQHTE